MPEEKVLKGKGKDDKVETISVTDFEAMKIELAAAKDETAKLKTDNIKKDNLAYLTSVTTVFGNDDIIKKFSDDKINFVEAMKDSLTVASKFCDDLKTSFVHTKPAPQGSGEEDELDDKFTPKDVNEAIAHVKSEYKLTGNEALDKCVALFPNLYKGNKTDV